MSNLIYSCPCGPTYDGTIAVNDIPKYSIKELVNVAIRKLASLGVNNIYDLLSIDDSPEADGFVVMCDILKDTLDRFEYLEPFDIEITPYYQSGEQYKFQDNFWDFIQGKVDRRNLEFVPRHIVSIIGTYLGTLRGVRYEAPYLSQVTYTGRYATRIIANRPVMIKREGNQFSDDSYIYYISEYERPRLKRLKDLFTVQLGSYIIRLNENLEHPNLPLNTFQGLQNFISDLSSQNKDDFESSFGYYGGYSFG